MYLPLGGVMRTRVQPTIRGLSLSVMSTAVSRYDRHMADIASTSWQCRLHSYCAFPLSFFAPLNVLGTRHSSVGNEPIASTVLASRQKLRMMGWTGETEGWMRDERSDLHRPPYRKCRCGFLGGFCTLQVPLYL
jgi:hypothetical protein